MTVLAATTATTPTSTDPSAPASTAGPVARPSWGRRTAVAAGFQERARVLYKELRFEGQPVFASIPEPHVKVVLYERRFA